MATRAWEDKLPIKTYLLGRDDPNPPWDKRGEHLIYPYSMQDNLSGEVRTVDYRALHLENDYAHAIVLPELGGHMYSLYDKIGRREVFYRNNVVKYGLVARRGAWISGGIEFNFPKGHTCVTVAPVLSDLTEGEEPSIRVGSLDRTTRMRWTVKLWLEGCALRQKVVLENPTPLRQRHYFWANSAVPAADDLHLVYPAAKARTGGGVHCYPVKDGLDMSWYRNHDHADDIFTLDVRDDFFGCYYEEQDCGMVHWSDHHKNFGKKFFTWGTADDGMRWVDLLTDDDGQYVEIQSGRFVDQSTFEFLSPFQQVSWEEQWWGLHGTRGFVWANEAGALNLKVQGRQAQVACLPARGSGEASGRLVLWSAEGRRLWEQPVQLSPGRPVTATAELPELPAGAGLKLALTCSHCDDEIITYVSPAPHELRRAEPIVCAPAPDPAAAATAEGLCLQAVAAEKQAAFDRARDLYRQALDLEPDHAAAHFGLGLLDCRAGLFESARDSLLHTTERDPENDEAWYYLGLASLELGRREEAELVLWRLIGRTQCHDEAAVLLARMALAGPEEAYWEGRALADDLLAGVRPSDGVQWLREDEDEHYELLSAFDAESEVEEQAFATLMRRLGDDPEEWLEFLLVDARPTEAGSTALWGVARQASERVRNYPLVGYHLAVLEPEKAVEWRAEARAGDPTYCFPSRLEDLRALAAAAAADPTDWLARLLLGNVQAFLGRNEEALANWLTAAQINDGNAVLCRNIALAYSLWQQEHDLARAWYRKATAADPQEYHLYLEQDRALRRAEAGAQERLEALRQAPPEAHDRWELAALEVDCLVLLEQWEEALALMRAYTFLPWEGARGMHTLWVLALTGLAEQQRAAGDLAAALASYELALTYPHNLCVGRTAYSEEARLHWEAAELARQAEQCETRETHLRAAAEEKHRHVCEADLYSYRALEALGRCDEAAALADRLRLWSRRRLETHGEDRLALRIREELGVEV